jgi:hypothetical protein
LTLAAIEKRSLAGAVHTLLRVSPVGPPAVIPARTNNAARRKNRDDPGKYDKSDSQNV